MEVTDVTPALVGRPAGKNLCFVKVETDAGIHGWGECYTQSDRDEQITTHVEALARYLEGRDPQHIRHFLQVAYDDFAGRRGAMDYYCAISGLEQALWDVNGKDLGAPVHRLLGGACGTGSASTRTAGPAGPRVRRNSPTRRARWWTRGSTR